MFSKKPENKPVPGDEALIEDVYRDFKRLMFSTAGQYVSHPSDREDVVHGAIERLIKHAPTLRTMDRPALAGYVVFTVRSSAVDFLRRRERQEGRSVSLEDGDLDALETPSLPLDDLLISAERTSALNEALSRLSEPDRLLLEGKYFYDCSDGELAELVGCKPDSVRMKLTRARRRALKCLSEMGEEGQSHDQD